VTAARTALDLIREHDISQLPVLEKGKAVGTVIENELMSAVLNDNTVLDAPVSKVIRSPFPLIGAHSPIDHPIELLKKKHSAILIEEEQKITGILRRYDMIEYMAK
jgi:cystathionine beta-synthase